MRFRLLLVRLLSLFALAICAAQFADFITQAGAMCDFGDTCEQVTDSIYGKPLGVPLPAIGIVGFGMLFSFTLVPKPWALQLVRSLAIVGGMIGTGLMIVQFAVLQKVCIFCMLVDSTAIILAAISLMGLPQPEALSKIRLLGWIMAAPMFALLPMGWMAAMMPDTAPEGVQKHWVPGEITIVEVTDFLCQHCQRSDAILQQVLKNHKNVRLVRLVAPMPSHDHDHGKDAASAFIAARKQGKGEEMAQLLYKAASREPTKCREFAEKIGLDLNEYDRTIKDDSTSIEIITTREWAIKTIKQGLPFMWVQNQFIKGTPTPNDLEEAINKAKPPVK